MKIEIIDIDKHNFKELLAPCQSCLYWEAPEKSGKDEGDKPLVSESEAIETKRNWFEKTGQKFDICGKILYIDGQAAGFAQYAPPQFFKKLAEYSRELFPPDPDGILISCLYIQRDYQGKGLGTKLLKALIKDLKEKGYRTLETYSRNDSTSNASGPTVLYIENGFKQAKTKKWGNGSYSLMRLELNS